MTLPIEFIIHKKFALLGSVSSNGIPKCLIDIEYIHKMWVDRMNETELIELLNNHKPLIIHHYRPKLLNNKLVNYINKINLQYIVLPKPSQCIISFTQSKYEKQAILLYLLCYENNTIRTEIITTIQHKLKLLHLSNSIIKFIDDYIIGYLLGYRASSIKGFYIRKILLRIIYKNNKNVTFPLIRTKQIWIDNFKDKKSLKLFNEANKIFKFSEKYNKLLNEYSILQIECNMFIKYILNKCPQFKKYYEVKKTNIRQYY